jgi:hypothetical protein
MLILNLDENILFYIPVLCTDFSAQTTRSVVAFVFFLNILIIFVKHIAIKLCFIIKYNFILV